MKFSKWFVFGVIILCLLSLSGLLIQRSLITQSGNYSFEKVIRSYLEEKTRLPALSPRFQIPKQKKIIYIMGGAEPDLKARFKTAAGLFKSGMGEQIWLYIQSGITAYDPILERNLTNIEWAIKQLAAYNITAKDIVFVDVDEGFMGTFSESQYVIDRAVRLGYSHVSIVTSANHTRRVSLAFAGTSELKNISFSVYADDGASSLQNLMIEYGKLMLYRYVVLPLDAVHLLFMEY